MNPRTVLGFALGPVGVAIMGVVTLPVVTWFYTQEDVGRIAMLQVAINFCVLLFGLGLDQAYVREFHDSNNRAALFKECLLPGLFLLMLGLSGFIFEPGLISRVLFAIDSAWLSALAAVCFIAAFLSRFLSLTIRMQERGVAFSLAPLLQRLVFLLLVGFVVLMSMGGQFGWLVVAQTVSIVAACVLNSMNARRALIGSIGERVNVDNLRRLIRYGFPLILGGVAFWGLMAIDRLFLRYYSSFDQLGIYSVSVSFAAAATIFQTVFSTVWAPTVYKWVSDGIGMDSFVDATQKILICVLLLFCLAGSFSWLVDFVLPGSYAEVKYILVACLGYPLLYTLSETTVVGINIRRRTTFAMLASCLAFFVNLAGNWFLVPRFGAAGAAVSTTLAFWVFLVLRTEFSVWLWAPFPRLSLYLLSLVMVSAATLTALMRDSLGYYLHIGWFLMFCTVLIFYNSQIVDMLRWVRPRRDGTGA